MNQRSGHLVHGAIATHGDNDIDASLRTVFGNLSRMSGIFRQHEFCIKQLMIQRLVYQLRNLFFRVCSRDGVQNEYYFLLFSHILLQKYKKRVIKREFKVEKLLKTKFS